MSIKFIFFILLISQVLLSFAQRAPINNILLTNKSYSKIETGPSANRKIALIDIQKKNIKLYLSGSEGGSSALITDDVFEKKYDLKLTGLVCIHAKEDNHVEYNQTIFAYLDKRYGRQWRREVRQDVIGLNR
ncbi:MAG TPA: hypothetical protein PK289_00900 [Bacteroidia bacterium]|jgi:hypothetical protein|nr:hypothetical protein [Bacteroidia bacterium]HRG51717.1 hypothetical protein [Bacteroidia bacterium]